MDTHNCEICGFLDVKSMRNKYFKQKMRKKSLKSKLWKRLWCSVNKLGPGLGVQIQFKSRLCYSNNIFKQNEKSDTVTIPPSAIIYRLCSKTRQFAFGISTEKGTKPLLSLSANSETEAQRWMTNIRYLLQPRRDYCIEKSYNVSIIDNAHSKAAGLTGLYGNLTANEAGLFIKNTHSGEIIENFEWKQFNQFHLMTIGRPEDVKRICVIHTTKEFRCGIGELYIFCLDARKLLQDLVTEGRGTKSKQEFWNFNNENGSLGISAQYNDIIGNSLHLKSNALPSVLNIKINRKSDLSITSGIYEEILDNVHSPKSKSIASNIYEDADKVLYSLQVEPSSPPPPPPLPPRQRENVEQYSVSEIFKPNNRLQNTGVNIQEEDILLENTVYVPMSQPRRISIFNSHTIKDSKENDYVIMR